MDGTVDDATYGSPGAPIEELAPIQGAGSLYSSGCRLNLSEMGLEQSLEPLFCWPSAAKQGFSDRFVGF